ncbi:MAG: type II secretion system protein, partial [Gammaproteobacteria bacterium]
MRHRAQHGFTLIELAVVTAVIGLLAAGAMTGIGALRTNTKIKETHAALDHAALHLQRFLVRNGRLPCPADPTLGPADAGYAREHLAAGGATCHATRQVGATGLSRGTLPFATLGAPPREVVDGWNNQVNYLLVTGAAAPAALTSAA